MTCGVYEIAHVDSGRRYVGKSIDIERRIRDHFHASRFNRSASHLHRAIRKYGKAQFAWRILEVCSNEKQALERECFWIMEFFGCQEPYGFNTAPGGSGGMSGVSCPAVAAANRRRVPSNETRARLHEALLGNKHRAGKPTTLETRQKLSAARRRYLAEHGPVFGRKASAETRAKMAASRRRYVEERRTAKAE